MPKRVRGFEVITEYKDAGIELPQRKTEKSAGYDLSAAKDVLVKAGQVALVPTGLKAYMPDNEYLSIKLRSSVGVKRGLRLANEEGIIDADYYNNPDNEGHIFIAIWNPHPYHDALITKGERIAQAIFCKYFIVDDDTPGGKRVGGIGSTDK